MSISASTRGVKSRLTPSTVRESRPVFGRSRGAAPLVGQNSERSLARGAMSGALDLGRFLVKPRVHKDRAQTLADPRRLGLGGAHETIDAHIAALEQLRKPIESFGAI